MNAVLSPPPARWSGRALAFAASAGLHLLALLALPAMRSTPQPAPAPPLKISIQAIHARLLPAPASERQAQTRPPVPAEPRRSASSSRAAPASARGLPGKAAASAGKSEARVTLEGLRQQVRQFTPENPDAKPLPENPEKARLARGIDRAERADCKNAYAGLGLLAAPMLLKDALDKDNGCKW
ncbi:hypothetical protein ACFFU8_08665 [Chromobacterium piscinae]|uniref:hypothetical protein n=1 Tax=Chromobacterium piscinae TaxID=686831 RepID=UPI001E5B5FD3|nr:hypothetical protein [Chromobacterium piscinae]MCD5327247.1 hypothetical protein [Chromobacterium piscinae]